jgi:hypothetical protein
MSTVEDQFKSAKMNIIYKFGYDGNGTTNRRIENSKNTFMPDIDYYNKKIIWKKLIEMDNNWVYPHEDTLISNNISDIKFTQNYNRMYALKNKAEILLNMFNMGDLFERHPKSFGMLVGGGMKNQKVKKCEKKKVVLGKERCIYKVSGSKKDYMKYKGKLVPVSDYVKYMKKKN